MKGKGHIQSFNEHQKNLNISGVSNSNLINQIKKYKKELLLDLEEMVYTSEQSIPDSFFNLSRLIDKL
jgi:hypothetical protein